MVVASIFACIHIQRIDHCRGSTSAVRMVVGAIHTTEVGRLRWLLQFSLACLLNASITAEGRPLLCEWLRRQFTQQRLDGRSGCFNLHLRTCVMHRSLQRLDLCCANGCGSNSHSRCGTFAVVAAILICVDVQPIDHHEGSISAEGSGTVPRHTAGLGSRPRWFHLLVTCMI